MTYVQFHLVFTVPVLCMLKLARPRVPARDIAKAGVSLFVITLIAFVYTTPWDNFLVEQGVWGYGEGRVWGTWGHVPVEEYFFFIIQPLITGLWLYRLLWKRAVPLAPLVPAARWWGVGVLLGLSALGYAGLRYEPSYYLGLILVWAGPVLALQWAYGGQHLWRWRWLVVAAVAPPTVYLWVADRLAIGSGIWYISERYTLGLTPFGLPVEEALFFLVTNLLVVQGLLLTLHTLKARVLAPKPSKRNPTPERSREPVAVTA